jgi:hypothetical protein
MAPRFPLLAGLSSSSWPAFSLAKDLGQSFDQDVPIRDLLAHLRHQRGLLVALTAELVDLLCALLRTPQSGDETQQVGLTVQRLEVVETSRLSAKSADGSILSRLVKSCIGQEPSHAPFISAGSSAERVAVFDR